MKKVFDAADQYCKESDWKTLEMLKICVFSMGVLVGMRIPEDKKDDVRTVCGGLYSATLGPLLGKYINILRR